MQSPRKKRVISEAAKQPTKPPIKHNPAGSEGGKTDSVSYQAEDVGEEVADEQCVVCHALLCDA